MTPVQQVLFDKIQEMKQVLRNEGPYIHHETGRIINRGQYRATMQAVAHKLTSYDDRTPEAKKYLYKPQDSGGRSRSPSFGIFEKD